MSSRKKPEKPDPWQRNLFQFLPNSKVVIRETEDWFQREEVNESGKIERVEVACKHCQWIVLIHEKGDGARILEDIIPLVKSVHRRITKEETIDAATA